MQVRARAVRQRETTTGTMSARLHLLQPLFSVRPSHWPSSLAARRARTPIRPRPRRAPRKTRSPCSTSQACRSQCRGREAPCSRQPRAWPTSPWAASRPSRVSSAASARALRRRARCAQATCARRFQQEDLHSTAARSQTPPRARATNRECAWQPLRCAPRKSSAACVPGACCRACRSRRRSVRSWWRRRQDA